MVASSDPSPRAVLRRPAFRIPDVWGCLTIAAFVCMGIFVVWPLFGVFTASFFAEFTGAFGIENYFTFFGSGYFRRALWNSLTVSALGTAGAVAIGLPLAIVMARYHLSGTKVLRILVILSLLSPPFIGAYAWIMLLGRAGILTRLLQSVGIDPPTIYGPGGIVLVSMLQLYPLVFLLAYGALQKLDRSLEEAAMNLGRTPGSAFRTVSLPLMRPAIFTGALLVFLSILSEFGTPSLIGENYPVLATLAFTLYLSEIGGNPAMASTTSVVLVVIAMAVILLLRIGLKRSGHTVDVAVQPPPKRELEGWRRIAVPGFAWSVGLLANLPLLVIIYTSFLETQGPVFGSSLSLESYRTVFAVVGRAVVNSLTFSIMALVMIAIAGSLIGYVLARRDSWATRALDSLLMIPYVIPGTVLGIGFVTAFNSPPLYITGTVVIILVAYFIRRLPYMVRAAASVVYQIDRSVEEASINLGVPPLATFRRIMIPLMWPGLLAGATLAWVEVINELSATIVLYTGSTVTMPIATYSQVIGGAYGTAAAIASMLILATAIALALLSRLGGADERMTL